MGRASRIFGRSKREGRCARCQARGFDEPSRSSCAFYVFSYRRNTLPTTRGSRGSKMRQRSELPPTPDPDGASENGGVSASVFSSKSCRSNSWISFKSERILVRSAGVSRLKKPRFLSARSSRLACKTYSAMRGNLRSARRVFGSVATPAAAIRLRFFAGHNRTKGVAEG